jgi:hypothetical protein
MEPDPNLLDPKGGEVTFFWPYPRHSIMTDEAVKKLVDQGLMINQKVGRSVRGRITKALNQPENAGVLLTLKYRPFD